MSDIVMPVLNSYVPIAASIGVEEMSPLAVIYFQSHAAQPIDSLISRLDGYNRGPAPTGTLQEEMRNTALSLAMEAQFAINLSRAWLESASIDLIVPRAREADDLRNTASATLLVANETAAVVKRALDSAQAAARTEGLIGNVQAFASAATSYENASILWGVFALVAGAALLLFAACSASARVPYADKSWTTGDNLLFFGERVFLASVLSFGMVTFVRNFRAASHNAVLNRHRLRALQTFEQLRAGTGDERMKDAILLQAAEAAFAMQPTGFSEGPMGVTRAHELLELVKPRTKPE